MSSTSTISKIEKPRSSKAGEIVFNAKDGIKWSEFKDTYSKYLDTSAFYIIRTPKTINAKGDLIKLGISSIGSSEIIRRLSDYERYYDGDFHVLHLRVWYKYVKNTNQTRSPQEKYELEVKRKMKEVTTPQYGNEWFKHEDLDKIYEVMKGMDKSNKPIEYIAPKRNPPRNSKDVTVDTFIKRKYSHRFYIGVVYRIDKDIEGTWYSVIFFDKDKINFDDVDVLNVVEVKDGRKLFSEWEQKNEEKANRYRSEWSKTKNEYGLEL